MAEANPDAGDWISELPEPLLHYVLSFIPIKDAAKTCTLSKRWNHIWATLPYLDFGEGFLDEFISSGRQRDDLKKLKKNKRLLQLANHIILCRCQQIASIEKLCLTIPEHEMSRKGQLFEKKFPGPLDFMVEKLISCVAHRGLKVLEFKILTFSKNRLFTVSDWFYNLPATVLSAKSLNVLSLVGFDLRSLSSLNLKFPSLRKLWLERVCLEDDIIGNLITGCPLLENVQLHSCEGLKTLYVTGLLKLKLLEVLCNTDLKILEIHAPDLQVLGVAFPLRSCRVNVATCSSLTELSLDGGFVTDKWFNHFISQCLFLENLSIGAGTLLENIRISTNTLKNFKVAVMKGLEAEINAPNLEKFHCLACVLLPSISLDASDLLEIELELFPREADDCWYSQLAEFLGNFDHCKTVKVYGGSHDAIIIPKENRVSLLSPLYDTRNLIFFARTMEFDAVELVEYMLWLSPCAKTLSIASKDSQYREKTNTVLKFHYGENVHRDSLCPCCKFIDCWHHCLSEIRLEKFEGDEDERRKMELFFSKHVNNLKIEEVSSSYLYDGLYSDYDKLFQDGF